MKTIRLYFAVLALFFLAVSICQAQNNSLAGRINAYVNSPANSRTLFSIHIKDIDTGQTVYQFNSGRAQKPASNMKIITTAAALDILGPDFQYDTLYGLIDDDLAIIASGDPLIGDPVLAENRGRDIFQVFDVLAAKLKENNIDTIKGDLIIDESIFDDERFHPGWDIAQSNRWYAAQVAGLNFNDNCIDILFSPAELGQPANYTLMPDTAFINIRNNCKTVNTGGTKVGALRAINTNNVTLIGQCQTPLVKPIYLAIDNPSAFHGFVLSERLAKEHNIKILGKLIIKKITDQQHNPPANFKPLLLHQTNISTVLDQCNQRSLNLAAEALFKSVGTIDPQADDKTILRQGSWANGRKNIETFLAKLNIPAEQFQIDDGSGLSHNNKISAEAITSVLAYMHKHKNAEMFIKSMACAENGTLANRNRFNDYQGRVYAKTGSISGVNTLSGYCQDKQGRWLAFSILTATPAASNSTIDQIVRFCMQ